jgi:hypothetical protein
MKACKSGSVRKTPLERGGRDTSHMNCKQTSQPEKEGIAPLLPVCLEREKLVTVVIPPRRTLNKQSLWD